MNFSICSMCKWMRTTPPITNNLGSKKLFFSFLLAMHDWSNGATYLKYMLEPTNFFLIKKIAHLRHVLKVRTTCWMPMPLHPTPNYYSKKCHCYYSKPWFFPQTNPNQKIIIIIINLFIYLINFRIRTWIFQVLGPIPQF